VPTEEELLALELHPLRQHGYTHKKEGSDPVFDYIDASATWDPGSIADGDEEAKEVDVVGVVLGDFALASFSKDLADLILDAQITATDKVTCVLANNTGGAIDLASGTLYIRVIKLTS